MKEPSVVLLFLTLSILAVLPGVLVRPVEGVPQPEYYSFSPFGPRTKNLVMTVYEDSANLVTATRNGEVDLPDSVASFVDEHEFASKPDFLVTERQPESDIFQLDINHHNTFLGIPMQETRGSDGFNSPSTKQATAAGIEARRGIAHLLDKEAFTRGAQLQGRALYVDTQVSFLQALGGIPSQLSAAVRAEDCAAHPWFTPCDGSSPPVSAYNLVADSLADPFHSFANLGYPGTADLRAACDHFVMAGFPISPSGSDCLAVAQGTAKLVSTEQANFYIRTHLPRKAFGTILADALNFLFGSCTIILGTSCAEPTYYNIAAVVDTIFQTEPNRDDWHLYTGGWSLSSIPDHLYPLYYSQFAGTACGGMSSSFAANYEFYCSPKFDQEALAGQSAPTLTEAYPRFTEAVLVAHREVMTVPVYSSLVKFVALEGWNFQETGTYPPSSLVPGLAHGWSAGFGYWSFLNMRQKPGYVPSDPRYAPGGGNPDLIRRGISQPVLNLSPFHTLTFWDLEVLSAIYDSMLVTNPFTGGAYLETFDWMTARHTQSYDPDEAFGGFTGITTQTWVLRNDLKWHDGHLLTAEDVVFTLTKYRDFPPARVQAHVSNILEAVALNSRTVQVKLPGQSPFWELNIGTLPIIPRHVWEPLGDAAIADPGFDPMASGKMVGSGPWVCKNPTTGSVGGPCTVDAGGSPSGQTVEPGGKVFLTAYDGFHRGRPGVPDSSLHKFSWADRNNDARVDIIDIADIGSHFSSPDAYWNTGQNPAAPQTVGSDAARVDIAEVATAASYFGHGLFTQVTIWPANLEFDIDPFF